MAGGNIFADQSNYFQGLQQNRIQQAYLQKLQEMQSRQSAMKNFLEMQRQQQADKFKTQDEQRLGDYLKIAQQRQTNTVAQQKALADLYGGLHGLDSKATVNDAAPLAAAAASAGLPQPAIASAIKLRFPEAAGGSAVEKWLSAPLGEPLAGHTIMTPEGEPFSDPMMTRADALKAGGVMLTDKDADLLRQSKSASANLQGILEAGKQILPMTPSVGAATVGPMQRWARTKMGDPVYADYSHALAGIIPYMRSLAGVGRVNQTELNLIVDRLQSANTYPALEAAVKRANQIIDDANAGITQAGRLTPSGRGMASSAMSSAPSNAQIVGYTPEGKAVYQRPGGKPFTTE